MSETDSHAIRSPEHEKRSRSISISTISRRATLGLVTGAASMIALDGAVMSILVEPVKQDLRLTDTQLGLVVGLALSLVSALASLPFSRWADVGVRRTVLTVAVLVCSAGTVAIGLAQGFWQLLAARVAQGIGTGGGMTPGQSILADLYPPQRRAGVLAAFGVGINLASTLGTTVAAYVADAVGWRWVFWSLGAPGVVLAVVMRATMKEPARPVSADGGSHALPLPEALRNLATRGTFRHVTIGMTLLVFGMMGVFGWAAPYLMRSFDKSLSEVAPVVGIGLGGVLTIGGITGGILADRLSQRDLRWHLWLPIVGAVLGLPFLTGYLLIPTYWIAVLSGAIAMTLLGLCTAPLQAAVLGSVHPQARATSMAVMSVFTQGLGAAGGMFTVGALSDWLTPMFGIHSLRWATAALLPICIWACLHLWIASQHYAAEAEAVQD